MPAYTPLNPAVRPDWLHRTACCALDTPPRPRATARCFNPTRLVDHFAVFDANHRAAAARDPSGAAYPST